MVSGGGFAPGYGWVNGEWQKAPTPFGASSAVIGNFSDANLPAGNAWLNGPDVPAGEIQIITTVTIAYVGTVPLFLQVYARIDGVICGVADQQLPVSSQAYPTTVQVILFPGDSMRGYVAGATLNDDLYFQYIGYRIDIDQ